jgi:hypothetical protein
MKWGCLVKEPFSAGRMVVSIFLAGTLSGCDYFPQTRVLAQALEVSGQVYETIKPAPGSSARIPLKPNSTIRPGETIETESDSTALVSLAPGMIVLLKPETELRIDELVMVTMRDSTTYYIQSRQARIRLVHGSLYAATPATFESAALQVVTPSGLLIAPPAACFYVRADPNIVRATTLKGELRFRQNSGQADETLGPGFFRTWGAQGASGSSKQQSAEADEAAIQQVKEARVFEQRVGELMLERKNVLPAWPRP